MQIHHLNCGAMQPYGGALMDGRSPIPAPASMACHCLLLETDDGLVLVDTGTVSTDPAFDRTHLDPAFLAMNRIRLDAGEAAANQVRARGLNPADVKHVVMTHLDFDHAAGLRDFPGAAVHVSAAEAHAARNPSGLIERRRYTPAQWGGTGNWHEHSDFDTDWFGIPAAPVLPGVSLVWLPGHSEGHCGVAIKADGGWLLHAADAIFNAAELDAGHPRMPTGARFYQWMMETSQSKRRRSLKDVRRVVREHGDEVEVICTHDPALIDTSPAP